MLMVLIVKDNNPVISSAKIWVGGEGLMWNESQIFFIVAPCILVYVENTQQQMRFIFLKTH